MVACALTCLRPHPLADALPDVLRVVVGDAEGGCCLPDGAAVIGHPLAKVVHAVRPVGAMDGSHQLILTMSLPRSQRSANATVGASKSRSFMPIASAIPSR